MSVHPDDDLKKAYDVFREDQDRLRNELMAVLPDPSVEQDKRSSGHLLARLRRNRIMQACTKRWFVPAAAAIVLGIALWPFAGSTGRVYGISEVAELLRAARTLHIEGFFYPPQAGESPGKPQKVPLEYWFDVENGRTCKRTPPGYKVPEGEQPPFLGSVCDGTYLMDFGYTKPLRGKGYPTVRFSRRTPFQARIEAYQGVHEALTQLFHVDQVEGFVQVGQEKLNGETFTIWQGEVQGFDGQGVARIRSWLSAKTGQLGKVLFWEKRPKRDWHLFFEFTCIERDVAPPEGVFTTTPPPGHKAENTKEDAPLGVLGGRYVGDAMPFALLVHIGFVLPDGSMLLAWSSPERSLMDQSSLFEDLRPGGPLPVLPAVITGLEPMPSKSPVRYTGRHLMYTKKNGAFYEWSLYVPQPVVPDRRSFLAFNLLTDYNAPKDQFGTRSVGLSQDLPIRSRQEFDRWIRGAIADLSDAGTAPEAITYDYVMNLSRQIRASLPTSCPATQPAVSALPTH